MVVPEKAGIHEFGDELVVGIDRAVGDIDTGKRAVGIATPALEILESHYDRLAAFITRVVYAVDIPKVVVITGEYISGFTIADEIARDAKARCGAERRLSKRSCPAKVQ